jgi:hypothetical protein
MGRMDATERIIHLITQVEDCCRTAQTCAGEARMLIQHELLAPELRPEP